MNSIEIDIETYSDVDLSKCGVYKYSSSPNFEILLFGFSVDGGEVEVVDVACGEEIPADILAALSDESVIKWAFNAMFERVCLSNYLGEWLEPESWKCSMVWSATLGLPLSLENVGAVLGLEKQKLSEGKELIRYFCVPCKPTKTNGGRTRNLPEHDREKWERFKEYNLGYTMDGFRKAVKAAMGSPSSGTDGYTKIMGNAVATAEQMEAYLKATNPSVAQSVLDMVPLYLSEGKTEGVRGDVAFAQSCLETGNFGFSGSAVTLDQNNFCGMGVTSNGVKGNSFDTPQLGIRAQVQHLKAYASTEALKNACVDPRFQYVTRGCAEYVEWLGQKENPDGKGWATGAGYGEKILTILKGILGTAGGAASSAPAETEIWYRVRKTWADAASQKGAFKVLENAKKCADENPGYSVFDESGKAVYSSAAAFKPYLVRVTITNLNIRKGPGTNYDRTGKYTGIGSFTIVDEADGEGASKWGLLKSYQSGRNGWVSLDYAKRV